jgi:uncharacterized protein
MTLLTVRCDDAPPQPWQNGGGFTRELLAWPSRDGWAVRISVADIAADGPFSAFAGVDRWFAVLDGAGVRLALPDGEHVVRAASAPLHFAGEAAPHCRPLDGPTRDLNLMSRRDAGRATMQRAAPGRAWAVDKGLRALFAADALVLQAGDGTSAAVPAMALAWSADGPPAPWTVVADRSVRAWWIQFVPRSS